MDKVVSFYEDFAASISLEFRLDLKKERKMLKVQAEEIDQQEELPVFTKEDELSGGLALELRNKTTKLQHLGLKLTLIGSLQIYPNETLSLTFLNSERILQPEGTFTENKYYKFCFVNFYHHCETLVCTSSRIKYELQAVLKRNYLAPLIKKLPFAVLLPENDVGPFGKITPMCIELGYKTNFHIRLECSNTRLHLKDTIVGKLIFCRLTIEISKIELSLIRKQVFGLDQHFRTQSETLSTFQILDGNPKEGDSIPVRVFLRGIKRITPSYKNILNRLSLRYYLNVTIYTQSDQKYFKEIQITLYRLN